MFVTVKLVKNVDVDKYKYSGYDIGFDRYETFSVANEFGRNVKLFGVDMNSSILFDNKKKKYLSSWWRSYTRNRLYYTDFKKEYSISFTECRIKFCLGLH